jgi:hypothetical protein
MNCFLSTVVCDAERTTKIRRRGETPAEEAS